MSSLKTIGGKDEPNIIFYAEIVTTSQHRTQNVKTNNRTAKKLKMCQWLASGLWISPDPPVSSTNKNDRHNITEMLLKVA